MSEVEHEHENEKTRISVLGLDQDCLEDDDGTRIDFLFDPPAELADVVNGEIVKPDDLKIEDREHVVHDIRVHIDRILKPKWNVDNHTRVVQFNGYTHAHGWSRSNSQMNSSAKGLVGRADMLYTLSEVKEAIAPYVKHGWFVTVGQERVKTELGFIDRRVVQSWQATDSWLRETSETDHETGALSLTFFRSPPGHVPTVNTLVRMPALGLATALIFAIIGLVVSLASVPLASIPWAIGVTALVIGLANYPRSLNLKSGDRPGGNLIRERALSWTYSWEIEKAFTSGLENHHIQRRPDNKRVIT